MWPNPFPADLATFTEEILNGKLDFLCSAYLFFFFVFVTGLSATWKKKRIYEDWSLQRLGPYFF